MMNFMMPRSVRYGADSLEALRELNGTTAAICLGGGSMKRFGFVDTVRRYLKDAGISSYLIEGIEPDPSLETVAAGAKKMMDEGCDWIVALGGGSVIDAAKAMWILYEHPDADIAALSKTGGVPPLRAKARLCAIPSTSGSASEVTPCAVITDTKRGIKLPLAGPDLIPDIAIVDPALAQTMPPKLVAQTGMDALTHAIEAYVSLGNNEFSNALALHAAVLVSENIVDSHNGQERARALMHQASTMAGMAFANAGLGIAHSMAHKTGAVFSDLGSHIAHGAANAIYLPWVIEFNAAVPAACARYAELARAMGLNGSDDRELAKSLAQRTRELADELKLPCCLGEYGAGGVRSEQGFIPQQVFEQRLDGIAENALADACTPSNPRKLTAKDLKMLLMESYCGKAGA